MARATAGPSSSSSSSSSSSCSNSQAVTLIIPRAKPQEKALRLPPLRLELVGTRSLQKRWLRGPNLLPLRRLSRRMTTTCTFGCRGRRWRQCMPGEPRRCSTMFFRALGHLMPHQSFNQLRWNCRHPRCIIGLNISAPFRTRVSWSSSLVGLAIRAMIRWTHNRIKRR